MEENKITGDNGDFILGEDFEIAIEPEEEERPRKKKLSKAKRRQRAKSRLITTIWIFSIFAVSVLLAYGLIVVLSDMLGIRLKGNGEERIKVNIPAGLSTAQIADVLKENEVINSPFLFRVYSKLKHYDGSYKYGVYEFSYELGFEDIADKLTNEGAKAETVSVRIPEGATIDEIADILAENGVCTEEEFIKAVQTSEFDYDFVSAIPTDKVHYRLEGYLFPDTYEFYNYGSIICAEEAIDRMLKQTSVLFDSKAMAKLEDAGRSVHDIMTIASIVEMEASAAPAQMPKVAQVFYNRLVWDEPHYLGSSPTAEYPYGGGKYDTNANNPKATEGMPPGPYCAPSANAVKAALYPEEGFEATYFVTDSEMEFYYNTSYSAHKNTISRLKNEGKWVG